MKGFFITFEGIEGCGKTTQIKLLDEYLRDKGLKTLLTREPGGTPIGEKVRAILLDSTHKNMSPLVEMFLYSASRNQHVVEKIVPAISEGKIVLCDRYADATTAYQGAARKIDEQIIRDINRTATGGLMPDLTFVLDLPARVGLDRAIKRNSEDKSSHSYDRFEREELAFHERVRAGYLSIAKAEPDRVKIIDATLGIEALHEEIKSITQLHTRYFL